MSLIRRRIAERLVEAQQQAALLTTFNEIDMSAVIELRKQLSRAVPGTLRRQARLHVVLREGGRSMPSSSSPDSTPRSATTDIVYRNYYHIGIAIGAAQGLVVPVLRHAERMSFAEIEQAIDDFGRRRRQNKLKPNELEGGTFTIYQRRRLRLAVLHAHRQPAAKRRARHARHPGAPGRPRRPGRHPPDDVCRPHLRPSHRRRPRSRLVPAAHQGSDRRALRGC